MIDRNLSNSAENVFRILNKLLLSDCNRNFFEKDFSKDSFLIYISTLKKAGFDIGKIKGAFNYNLKNNINILGFDDEDIEFLTEIKKILMQSNNYMNVIYYNNFLLKLLKYADAKFKKEITNIIENISLKLSEHKFIFQLEKYINNKIPIKINYTSNLKEKTFKILPLYLQLDNSKMYLWGIDNTIKGLRCLKINRINTITEINEHFEAKEENNFGVCEFTNKEYLKVFNENNIKLLEKNKDKDTVKIYFPNQFEFFQKILSLGTTSKITEPINLKNEFIKTINNIREKYE